MTSGNVQVFLVDDNEPFRRSTAWLLEAADLDVRDFPSGPGLLDTIAQESPTTTASCLISDVRMPGMDGLTAIERIFESLGGPKVSCIMLTTESSADLKAKGKSIGIKGWILKPFKKDMLIKGVRAILEKAG